MRMVIKFSLVVAVLSTGSVFGQGPVYFADQKLKACVEDALATLDPTPSDMLDLTGFTCQHAEVEDLTGLEYATNLESLILNFNEIESISPLAGLINLTSLTIDDNQISSISALGGLDLWNLDAHNNQIQSVGALAGMTNLYDLVLYGNQISNIFALSDLENLEWLDVRDNDISSIAPLTSLTQLRSVDLRGNPLNDQAYDRYLQTILDNNPGVSLRYDPRPSPSVQGPPDTGGVSQPLLMLSSTAGGEVYSSYDASSFRLGDTVAITAVPVDPDLFVFANWSGSAVEEGKVPDPTDPLVRLVLNGTQSLKAHFLTTLTTLHVSSDSHVSVEPGPPQELGTPLQPFRQIQKAIDVAGQGVTIVVEQGIYAENLRFQGYDVALTGIGYPVLRDRDGTPLASFVGGEDADCVLNGFLLTLGKSDVASAIYCANSHPTISNCLIVGNQAAMPGGPGSAVRLVNSHMTLANCTIADNVSGGLGAGITLVDSDATVINSIFWNNGPDDLRMEGTSRPRISYSHVSVEPTLTNPSQSGPGNLSGDPGFVRPGQWADLPDEGPVWTAGDYHLRSQSGRWDSDTEQWVLDDETSPCIDGGDPVWPVGAEPMPNGSRMNMGAYGGTVEASKSVASLARGGLEDDGPVYFADQKLKACVEDALATLDPTPSDMLDLTGFSCRHAGVEDLTGLEYATNLESLTLNFNEIEDISPLADLINLTSLTIDDNQISSISALGGLDLWDLDAHNNQIQSVGALAGMTNMYDLVLYGNAISSMSALSGLENLEWLDISDNDISSIAPLTSLTQLRSVDLRGNPLNDQAYDRYLQTILDNNPGVSLQYDPRP